MKTSSSDPSSQLRVVALLRPYAGAMAIGLLAMVGESVTSLLEPWPLKIVFDHLSQFKPDHGRLERLVPATMDKPTVLLTVAIAVLVIAVVKAACSYLEKNATASVGQWLTHDLRRLLYAHIQRLSLAYHTQKQTGDLISRLTSDIDAVQSFIVTNLLGLAIDGFTLIGMSAVMFYLNWRFTLLALSIAPLLFAVSYFFTRRGKRLSRELRKKEGEIVSLLQEVLSAIGVVKVFAQEDYEQQRLEEKSAQSVQIALRARGVKAKLSPLVEIIAAAGTALVLWYGGGLVLSGALSAGSLVVFIWYLGKMYKPMQDFAKVTDAYTKAAVGYERLREVLATQPTVRDRPDAVTPPAIKGEIEFSHVNFGYDPARPVLKDVSARLAAGELTAVVGPTGSGKSTLAALIGRLYDPDSGSVKIDGLDVRSLRQKPLHDQISFVLQENVLFNAPVWQNIAYGKPRATSAEIQHAAELANAHEFIARLPQAYDTIVGERGVTLSGGQRQRIAIARAIIRETPILVMDEPSSGLDAASEELVFEAIERLIEGKTAIVIAHRFSTVRRAHRILVVQDGRIVENGKHEDLLAAGGLYSQLYDLQFRRAEAPALA
jgi:subfamily B ATP-binding cassette protein MsbA